MNKLLLVTNHFSVVVKGLEKKLRNLQYEVKMTDAGFLNITEDDYMSDVIILYLSDEMLDDQTILKELTMVCNKAKYKGCGLIVIGSGKNRKLYFDNAPVLESVVWIDQPVDMKLLTEKLEIVIEENSNRDAKKRLLLVDDDQLYGTMISNWLKKEYIINHVIDGMETISFLTNHKVDMILLDYEMPVVDGPQLLQMLRTHEETHNIPVMFLTGIRDRESIKRVVKLKPEGYILKTAGREEILRILGDFFDK
ncbi:MAG: response regulator [Lachnospiraceae bacterium]|nr:response regulator [Lachnospiraceae bacterium]